MAPRRTADQAEREANRDVSYYGSTTTGSSPAIPLRQPTAAPPQRMPGEDYSQQGAYRRAFDEVSYDSAQQYYADFPVAPNAPVNPREISAIMRYRRANAQRLILSQMPDTLERYPSLAAAIAEADIDESDARRLINMAELDSAFNAITSTSDPIRQRNIVLSMNPVQRQAFFEFFTAKVEELQREAQENPNWAENAWNTFYDGVVDPIFNGLIWANDTAQQAFRANVYGAQEAAREAADGNFGETAINFGLGMFTNASRYWDEVAPGVYDETYLNSLRAEYGTEEVNAFVRLEELKRDGEPDPFGRWIAEFVGTPMEDLVRSVTWRQFENPEYLQLARLVNTADQGNTAMLALSSLPDGLRDSELYDVAANALNITATLALDPTLIGAKAVGAYRAARYSLIKLSNAGGIDDAFRMRRTRVFFDSLGKDFDRLEKLDPAKRAVARDVMRRQYGTYLPPQVIDDMAESGVRNADDANSWFVSKMVAESILSGIGVGNKFGDTFADIWSATRQAKRRPLLPGKTTAGVIRSRVRLLAAIHNPTNKRFAERLAQRFDDAGDFAPGSTLEAGAFGARLSDEALSIGAEQGAVARRGAAGAFGRMAAQAPKKDDGSPSKLNRIGAALGYRYADKSVSARLDRMTRRFARAPFPVSVNLNDGRDAGLIYDWARVFLSRQDAAVVADVWRNAANQAQRKQLFNGLVKTHAGAKGVMLRDPSRSWRDFLPEVSRGGVYSPHLKMRRQDDGLFVWDQAERGAQAADNAVATVEDVVSIRPSVVDGQEYPLHLWQTSDNVKIPNFAEIEKAGVRASFLGALFGTTQGIAAQRVVDGWSILNLAGPRYYLRNSIEDYVFYAMTDGIWRNVYKGRRFGTAMRRVRGTKLGLVNRALQGKAVPIDDPEFSTKWQLIKSRFTEADRATAAQAMRDGDLTKIRELVSLAMARTKLNGWSKANQDDLLDFVTDHGAKLLDEVTETPMYGTSGLMPKVQHQALSVVVDPTDGASSVKLVRPSRKWGDVSPNGDNPLALQGWLRDLRGVADTDGPIGQAALRGIMAGEGDDVLIPRIAQIIRDDKAMKYQDRLAIFHAKNLTPEQFAGRYLADTRNMVSLPNGKPNENLLRMLRSQGDDSGRMFTTKELSPDDLKEIAVGDRPNSVLGQLVEEVPVANSIKSFDRLWAIMGEQYARVSREPIFLANYLEQRQILRPYERQLAEMFGTAAARSRSSKMATDRAYELTMSYTDNPRNRTLLAWNSRNVARYYRAQEDFARRALRVGKNYPQGFWKVALTYDALEDTGFVFTDENNEKYFIFPGTELSINAVNWALKRLPAFSDDGVFQLDETSYEMRGLVRMLSPSADAQQWLPTLSSPFAAIGIKSLMAAFPAFDSLERIALGEYGENSDFWQAMLPGHANRALAAMDREERSSTYSATFKDAVQVSAAAGAMPSPDAPQDDWDKYAKGLDTLVTTMLVLRAGLGLLLPAPPRLTARDVTDFARGGGILNMDSALREMIRVAAADGSQNPFADGLTNYVETFGLEAVPYSISTSGANDQFGSLAGLGSVVATVEGEKWVRANGDLVEGKYKTAAAWLMPRMGEYSSKQNRWLRSAGLRLPSTYSDAFEAARTAEGRFVLFRNRELADAEIAAAGAEYYEAKVSGDEAAAEAAWDRQRQLKADWTAVQSTIKADYPGLGDIEINSESRQRLLDNEIRPMLDYVLKERDKPAPAGAQNMADAIATLDLYSAEINRIEGRTQAETLDRRMLRLEAQRLLTEIGERDPNTRFFVSVLLLPLFNASYAPVTGDD